MYDRWVRFSKSSDFVSRRPSPLSPTPNSSAKRSSRSATECMNSEPRCWKKPSTSGKKGAGPNLAGQLPLSCAGNHQQQRVEQRHGSISRKLLRQRWMPLFLHPESTTDSRKISPESINSQASFPAFGWVIRKREPGSIDSRDICQSRRVGRETPLRPK